MGKYVNKGNADFAEARGHAYVDKSGLIAFVNRTLSTPNKMTCVSRARRFGKSLALQMLYAYYDCSCDSRSLFEGLAISRDPSFAEHLNKYYAIHLDITSFITGVSDRDRIVDEMVVGVNYDKKSKRHECRIERWRKNATEGLSKGPSEGLSWKQVAENLEINPDKLGLLVPLMKNPVLLKDLRIACGFTNSTKFKKRYIDPLLSLDLIAMTQPDKLTSPTQKYYLTEKGKKLL